VCDEWLGNLLAALISLRVFTLHTSSLVLWDAELAYLPFVRKVTDRAPHLEYFAVNWSANLYGLKQVHGEWVPCNSAEVPSHRQLASTCLFPDI
jgi:hypothetical protein